MIGPGLDRHALRLLSARGGVDDLIEAMGACGCSLAQHPTEEPPMPRSARLLLLALAPLLLFAACQRDGPAERTGRSIDRGVDRMTR